MTKEIILFYKYEIENCIFKSYHICKENAFLYIFEKYKDNKELFIEIDEYTNYSVKKILKNAWIIDDIDKVKNFNSLYSEQNNKIFKKLFNTILDSLYELCRDEKNKFVELYENLNLKNWNKIFLLGCDRYDRKLMKYCVKNGANNFNDGLYLSCELGNTRLVNYCISIGASDFNGGLIQTCVHDNVDIAMLMIEKGAININDAFNESCKYGSLNLVKYFCKLGNEDKDLNINVNEGFVYAFKHGKEEIMNYLRDLINNNEILSFACKHKCVSKICKLLKIDCNNCSYCGADHFKTCIYVYSRGIRIGEHCGSPVEYGDFCKNCLRKKVVINSIDPASGRSRYN